MKLPASNFCVLVLSLFWGLSLRLVLLPTASTLLPARPLPRRSAGSLALCSASWYRGPRGRSGGASGFHYLYRREFFSSETRFQGSSSFEVGCFDFSPAASSKLSTKGWQRREGIREELSSNSLRARPSRQSELPNRDLEMTAQQEAGLPLRQK